MSAFASLRKKYAHIIATVTALLAVHFVPDGVLVEVVVVVAPTQNKTALTLNATPKLLAADT